MNREEWPWLAVAGLALCLFLATACPWVLGGDNGEFATLAATGGVAHPPGFPLYVAFLRLFSFVPGSSPAHRAALVTAALGAVSVYGVGRAARAWGGSPGASAVAAAAYATSPILWKLSTHAEAFAPAAALAAFIVAASAPEPGTSGARRTALLGLLAGLGLSMHTTLVLLAPVGLHAFVRSVRRCERRWVAVLAALGGLVVGLSPYAYLWVSARTADPAIAWVWGDLNDSSSVIRHFARTEYGALRLGAGAGGPGPFVHVALLLRHAVVYLLGLPLVALAAFAVVVLKRRLPPRPRRDALLALVATFVTAGPAFAASFNRPLTDIGPLIVERFHLVPLVPLAVLCALALDVVLPRIGDRVFAALAGALFFAGVALSARSVREGSRPTLAYQVENVLRILPERTVVLGRGDDKFGGYLYARLALGVRPDVSYVAPAMLPLPWYREREGKRLGVHFPEIDGRTLHVADVVDALLAAGHPVALAGFVAQGLERSFATYPLGPVAMVVPRGGVTPSPERLLPKNLDVASRFRLEDPPPDEPGSWAALLQSDYAAPFRALALSFDAEGRHAEAEQCRARARSLAPGAAE